MHGIRKTEEIAAKHPERLVANPVHAKLVRTSGAFEKELVRLEECCGTRTGKSGIILEQEHLRSADWNEKLQAAEVALEDEPTRSTWTEMVTKTGREAFDYGPKMVQDVLRVVALNAGHAVRDVICEVEPIVGGSLRSPSTSWTASRASAFAPRSVFRSLYGPCTLRCNQSPSSKRPRARQSEPRGTNVRNAVLVPHGPRPVRGLKTGFSRQFPMARSRHEG